MRSSAGSQRWGPRPGVYPWIGCGACEFCRSDRENLCYKSSSLGIIRDGGFATHVTVPDSTYLFEYGDLDPALAATFACSGLTVYSAIRKLQPLDPERAILVVGAGGLGLAAVSMLRAMDHSCIILLDTCPDKRAAALAAGASFAFDNATPEIQQSIAGAAGGPLLAAIDFVNRSETVGVALEALGKGGRLVLVGVGGGEYRLSLAGLIFRPRSIIGSITGSRQELREVIALAEQGRLAPIPITRMPRDEVNQAMRRLESGGVVGRIVLS
jgi:alcohol dehydrogenase, propanol-preferring